VKQVRIHEAGRLVRAHVLKDIALDVEYADLRDFGCLCAIVSETLGRVLRKLGYSAVLVQGYFDRINAHCWLDLDNGTIIDATASQFKYKGEVLLTTARKSQSYVAQRAGDEALDWVNEHWLDQAPQMYEDRIQKIVNRVVKSLKSAEEAFMPTPSVSP